MEIDEDCGQDCIMDVDKADATDPQCVTEYIGDIFRHFRQEESRYLPHPEYMEKQADINEKMRGILVDWLVEVHLKYKLKHETLYLAINLIDRFLEKQQVSRKKLQLVGVSGMLIASKYEEIYPPEIRDFVYITDKAYTKDEILAMEITMLNALEFQITIPSPVAFLERFEKVNKCDDVQMNLARYVMELTLCDIKMLRYCPSHLAASAVFLSNKLLRRHTAWPSQLIKHTRYTESLIKSCAKEMCCLVEGADRSSLTAVRKKYAQQKFNSVSTMVASAGQDRARPLP